MNLFAFEDKVAIVTGGASGIGLGLVEQLAERGAHVVVADRNGKGAQEVAGRLQRLRGSVRAATVDVSDADGVQRLVDETVERHGRLDYMFNNAGIAIIGDTRKMTRADWDRIVDVNLKGVIHGVAAAYPHMVRQGFGHIVNTASAAGLAPAPGFTAYAATKHAVVGLSLSLRMEAARFGVRVSAVCPGIIDTPIAQHSVLLNADRNRALGSIPIRFYPAHRCARDILVGVMRNRPLILVTRFARIGWLLYRLAPGLMSRLVQREVRVSPILNEDAPRDEGTAAS